MMIGAYIGWFLIRAMPESYMANIAVWHPYFGEGGAESVAMNVIQGLQSNHNITLITMHPVEIEEVNQYYDMNVDTTVDVCRIGKIGPTLQSSSERFDQMIGRRIGRLHVAVFTRFMRSLADDFDLVFSTHGELSVDIPSIQYVHYPWYNRSEIPETIESHNPIKDVYNRLCGIVAAHDNDSIRHHTLLTNSDWTGRLIKDIYGVHPETVYPPVITTGFEPQPWKKRESGFVTVSRLVPRKNILRNIKIVRALRERGHDVHLHLIGPSPQTGYPEVVKEEVQRWEFISLEGRLPREELVEMLCTHKYGLHGMEYEHFGIIIAEFVAAGVIPFTPNSGGPCEILNQQEEMLYDTAPGAIKKIGSVLESRELQDELRESLPDIEKRFGPAQFRNRIQEIVSRKLERSSR